MNGFNIAEAGHAAVVLPPQSISGGKTAQAFAMKGYKHASILIASGAEATQDTSTLVLNVCSDANGDNAVAIPFAYYFQSSGGAGNDVLSTVNYATASGVTLSSANWAPNALIVIEIDANQLEASGVLLGTDSYLQVVLGGPSAVDYGCIIAVLSGARDAHAASASVTV
jgi:hypothetical protein